jgi:hypothetical protein
MATRFRLDNKAFGIHVLQSQGMATVLRKIAEPVKTRAESIAPVESGEYKSSFFVETRVRTAPPYKTQRVVATVGNRSQHAVQVEYGTGGGRRTPRHRVLGRALGSAKG